MCRMPVRVERMSKLTIFERPLNPRKMKTTHPLPGKQSNVNGFHDYSYTIVNDCFSWRLYETLFGGSYIGPGLLSYSSAVLSRHASKRFRNAYDCVSLDAFSRFVSVSALKKGSMDREVCLIPLGSPMV